MRKAGTLLLGAIASLGIYQVVRANGVAIPSAAPVETRAGTRTEEAVERYNTGIRHRDQALKAEEKAGTARKASDREKSTKRARENYEKALAHFRQAIAHDPKLPQAYNGAGFASRRLGDFHKALEYYDQAIQLSPRFADAIEYRGEAFLGLNMIEPAKQTYLQLFALDRQQAEQLLRAMKQYVEQKKAKPDGVAPAALAELEAWIAERSGVAETTQAMGLSGVHRSWP